jgi:hypothetical protein
MQLHLASCSFHLIAAMLNPATSAPRAATPLPAHGVDVGVADAAVGDVDQHVPGPTSRRWIVVAASGAPAAGAAKALAVNKAQLPSRLARRLGAVARRVSQAIKMSTRPAYS